MAQESFYGGRQGASCVIVKNYPDIVAMVDEFSAGGSTVREVNYGEYVIIDSPNKNSEENGCIYRRDMDTDTPAAGSKPADLGPNPTPEEIEAYKVAYKIYKEGPGHGAKYIGQVCGPDGKIRDITIGNYNPLAEHIEEWTPTEMTSGEDTDASIKYSQSNVKDSVGNITNYLIGFKFPYLVQKFIGEPVDSYYTQDLVVDITGATVAERPFFRKQQINIPKGVKGDSLSEIYIFPTIIPEGSLYYKAINPDGTPAGDRYELANEIGYVKIKDYDPTKLMIAFEYSEGTGYFEARNVNDKFQLHYGCYLINYRVSDQGEKTQIDIGPYRVISNITVSDEGKVIIKYTSSDNTHAEDYDTAQIKTIKEIKINTGDTEGAGDQIAYATYSVEGPDGQPADEVKPLGNFPINYIMETGVTALDDPQFPRDESHLLVLFSDPARRTSDISFNGKTGQTDLGNVRGLKEGISIIGFVQSENDLYYDGNPQGNNPRKPEDFREGCEGQCMVVAPNMNDRTIYAFDYLTNKQQPLDPISQSVIDPNQFIVISSESTEPTTLRTNGVQLNTKTRKSV